MEKIELYRPSNHTQGENFMSDHCYQCYKWRDDHEAKAQCDIVLRTMFYDLSDLKYPKQWRYVDGQPTCTSFKSREQHNAERKSYTPRCKNTIDMFS